MTRPKIAVIGCGGTISSLSRDPLDCLNYPDDGERLDAAEVLARVPELERLADLAPIPFRQVSSTALTVEDWFDLRTTIEHAQARHPDLAGIVVLHGTGSLEETAFFLHLTVRGRCPVVVVGAQRPLNAVGSDAPGNLAAAIRTAAAPGARGQGLLVVLNDEIHSARDVVKTSTYRVQSFRALDQGVLGYVDTDRVVFLRSLPADRLASPFVSLAVPSAIPRVDILYSYLGADTVLVEAALQAGASGLVAAGFAPGLVAPSVMARLEGLAADDFPVVMASRAFCGRVGDRTRLLRAGMIAGEDFSPQKARIILMLGLLNGFDVDALRRCFRSL